MNWSWTHAFPDCTHPDGAPFESPLELTDNSLRDLLVPHRSAAGRAALWLELRKLLPSTKMSPGPAVEYLLTSGRFDVRPLGRGLLVWGGLDCGAFSDRFVLDLLRRAQEP